MNMPVLVASKRPGHCVSAELRVLKAIPGAPTLELATCYATLGRLGAFMGDVSLVESSCSAAREIYISRGLRGNVRFAELAATMAAVKLACCEYMSALQLVEEVLPTCRVNLPSDHGLIEQLLCLRGDALAQYPLPFHTAASNAEALAISMRSQSHCAGPGCELHLRPDGAPLDVCVKCRRTFYC